MRNVLLSMSAVFLLAVGSNAMAHNCPNLAEEITTKIGEMANADPDMIAKAQTLHDEGMALHEGGDHDGSVAKLGEALQVLSDAE